MSLPEVGDLAVVVGAHCKGVENYIGKVAKVTGIYSRPDTYCNGCDMWLGDIQCATFDGHPYMFSTLRRIPPLSELEGVKDSRDLPVKEPA